MEDTRQEVPMCALPDFAGGARDDDRGKQGPSQGDQRRAGPNTEGRIAVRSDTAIEDEHVQQLPSTSDGKGGQLGDGTHDV